MAGEMTATAAAAGDRSSPARVLGSCLRGLRREVSASVAGVCVASAAVAVFAAGAPEGTSVVLATCVVFHGGIWLLVHGVRRGGAEPK